MSLTNKAVEFADVRERHKDVEFPKGIRFDINEGAFAISSSDAQHLQIDARITERRYSGACRRVALLANGVSLIASIQNRSEVENLGIGGKHSRFKNLTLETSWIAAQV